MRGCTARDEDGHDKHTLQWKLPAQRVPVEGCGLVTSSQDLKEISMCVEVTVGEIKRTVPPWALVPPF